MIQGIGLTEGSYKSTINVTTPGQKGVVEMTNIAGTPGDTEPKLPPLGPAAPKVDSEVLNLTLHQVNYHDLFTW